MFGADQPWLWRGQPRASYGLEPAIHTRVRAHATLDDVQVLEFTKSLLAAARSAGFDKREETLLPDMALLALLQHHGAATPLLDVTLDPTVGLYMATVGPSPEDDDEDGALFAIRKPVIAISDFDSRSIGQIFTSIGDAVAFYSAPDVSERLRIQRGHFLLGGVSTVDPRVMIPLAVESSSPMDRSWIWARMDGRGGVGPPAPATSDIGVFRVTAKFKRSLRDWLEARSGLTRDFVFPTSWHQPYLDRFAASHGRTASF
jgi:hypothetical protein